MASSRRAVRTALSVLALLAALPLLSGLIWADPASRAESALGRWLSGAPVEKAYVLTDRAVYAPGETLWWRAWLANGLTHTANSPSGVLYLELLGPDGAVAARRLARADSSRAWGGIALADTLAPGLYELRAYTRWMRNAGEGFFFRRQVRVTAPARAGAGPAFTFVRGPGGDSVLVRIRMPADGRGRAASGRLRWRLTGTGGELGAGDPRLGRDGSALVAAWLPDSASARGLVLGVLSGGEEAKIPVPAFREELSLALLPEGGELVAGLPARAGVVAADVLGRPVATAGRVEDERGRAVAEFSTDASGVALTEFVPEQGRFYRALAVQGGREWASPARETAASGAALRVEGGLAGSLAFRAEGRGVALPLTLLGHVRGRVAFSARGGTVEGTLPRERMPAGIVHLTVFDASGRPLAERLAWNPPPEAEAASVSVRPGRASYGLRERVSLEVGLARADGGILQGDLAVAVTSAPAGREGPDVASWLLAGSDLEGGLPDGWDGADLAAADRLLLTRGWRRFRWTDLLGGGPPEPEHEMEAGLALSGSVVDDVTKRPARGQHVGLLTLGAEQEYVVVRTDAEGRFAAGLSMTDSTDVVVQTRDRRGRGHYEVRLDRPDGPAPAPPLRAAPPDSAAGVYMAYWRAARGRLLAEREHGLDPDYRLLGEVTVEADRIRDVHEWWFKPTLGADLTVRPEDVRHPATTAVDMLRGIHPKFTVTHNQVMVSSSRGRSAARVFVDGAETDWSEVSALPSEWVDHIELVWDHTSLMPLSFMGSNKTPVVAFYTKRDRTLLPPGRGVASLRMAGYAAAREFFAPDYAVPDSSHAAPDLRSTLWWQPRVRVGTDGTASLTFWTGDVPGRYEIRVEGLTDDGRPVVGTTSFVVE